MKSLKIVSLLLASLSLTSCGSYGYHTQTSVTPLGERYAPTETVDFYYGQYGGGQKYEQVALLTVEGNKWDNMDSLIETIKREAAAFGADAVIGFETDEITRDQGFLAFDLLNVVTDQPAEYDHYQALTLKGVAIKFIN